MQVQCYIATCKEHCFNYHYIIDLFTLLCGTCMSASKSLIYALCNDMYSADNTTTIIFLQFTASCNHRYNNDLLPLLNPGTLLL